MFRTLDSLWTRWRAASIEPTKMTCQVGADEEYAQAESEYVAGRPQMEVTDTCQEQVRNHHANHSPDNIHR